MPKVKKCSGSYFVLIFNKTETNINVGGLGGLKFQKGYYIYVGSAMNNQLLNRVPRHTKPSSMKKNHWHIDYLLSSESTMIEKLFLIPSLVKDECSLAETLSSYADGAVLKFGSSDCSCDSHLFYFNQNNPFIMKLF